MERFKLNRNLATARACTCGAVILFAGAFANADGIPRFEILDLNDLNPNLIGQIPTAINDRGQITGWADFEGEGEIYGTIWTNGRATSLPYSPGDTFSDGWAINNAGLVIGTTTRVEEIRDRIFFYPTAAVWQNRTIFELLPLANDPPNWDLQYANDINDNNVIIGNGRDEDTQEPVAYVFRNGKLSSIPTLGGYRTDPVALNNDGVIVGQSWTSAGTYNGFILYPNGDMTDLGTLGGRDSRAMDIAENGLVCGWSQSPTEPTIAMIWDDEVPTNLGTLGGKQSHAAAINNAKQVVGFSTDDVHNGHMFYWEDGVMYNAIDLIRNDLGFGGRAVGHDINEAGQFIGTMYRDQTGDAPVVFTRVQFDVADPVPGVAGENNEFVISNAPKNVRVVLAGSLAMGMQQIPGCAGATVLLNKPQIVGSKMTDDNGDVSFSVKIPNAIAGKMTYFQAAIPSGCLVSNVSRFEF